MAGALPVGGPSSPALRKDAAYFDGLEALSELQRFYAQEHTRLLVALCADCSDLQRVASLGLAAAEAEAAPEATEELDPQSHPRTLALHLWSQQWREDAFRAPAGLSRSRGETPPGVSRASTVSNGLVAFDLPPEGAQIERPASPSQLAALDRAATFTSRSSPGSLMSHAPTGATRVSTASLGTRVSLTTSAQFPNPCMTCGQRPPQTAFVVNLHRLMNVHEHLDLLHEFTKSTAIAALTLVSAQSARDLFCTCIFLALLGLLYCDHELRYDLLSVQDLMNVVHLLPQKPEGNPNQFLQVMSVCKTMFSEWRTFIILTVNFFIICFSWASVTSTWLDPDTALSMFGEITGCDDESETLSVQLTVLTLMYLLHAIFTAIHNYETKFVMPLTRDGDNWDVRADGLPFRCRFFGLPSMWFQNQDTKDRLLHYVDGLNPGRKVRRIYPEELAMYAIACDDDNREELALMLQEASYFGGEDDCSDSKPSALDTLGTLGLELCFFVNVMQHIGMPHIGEYLSFRALQPSASISQGSMTPVAEIRDRLDRSRVSVREGSVHVIEGSVQN